MFIVMCKRNEPEWQVQHGGGLQGGQEGERSQSPWSTEILRDYGRARGYFRLPPHPAIHLLDGIAAAAGPGAELQCRWDQGFSCWSSDAQG